jgi:2-polyprenyl-6-methoxyphenol hydroxylase-like FAD-dependent oxidoreductase
MGELRIAVIGCGVAGQASALFLSRLGHKVTILERFAQPAPVGAGLLLQPSGLAVLKRLGLYEDALKAGAAVGGIDGRTISGRRVLDLAYRDLHPACGGLGIHRASLFDLLHRPVQAAPIELICNAPVAALEQDGNAVTPKGADGISYGAFDLAIVCDGAHSALRQNSTLCHRAPVYPWACLWGVFHDPQRRFAGVLSQRFASTQVMIGVLPVGINPADGSGDWVTLFWSLRQREIAAAPSRAALRETLLRTWPALGDLLPAADAMPAMAAATYRDVFMPRWRQRRVLFIGDAAHGTSPQLGQGANLALLDAFHLSRSLATGDVDQALDGFAAARRGQTAFYRLASRFLTPFYQSDFIALGSLRDLAFGTACRFPPSRELMLSTLAGIRRSAFRCEALDADGLLRLPA